MLQRYLAFRVVAGIVMIWLFIALVVGLLDFAEILSRAGDNPHSHLPLLVKIAIIKWPSSLQILLPFAILLGTALALLWLRRSSELVIIFTSGLRQRQLVLLIAVIGFLFGIVALLLDDWVAYSKERYRFYEYNVLAIGNEESNFDEIFIGLKFYYQSPDSHHYIHIYKANTTDNQLTHSTVIVTQRYSGRLKAHIFAQGGQITEQGWLLQDVTLYGPAQTPQKQSEYLLPIDIHLEDLAAISRDLDTVGFFSLPGFIALSKNIGTQTSIYQMQYFQKMFTPLLFANFAILALGIVRLVPPRKATGFAILQCFLWALALNFAVNLIGALGGAEQISVFWAVFAQLFFSGGVATVFLMRPGIR